MKNKELALIVSQVQTNKEKNFETLFESIWETVYYLSLKMMGNASDAEDVSQEVFIKIYKRIDELESPEAFNQWMNQTVIYTCNDALKSRTRKTKHIANDDIGELSDFIEEDNTEFLPAEVLDSKETRTLIDQLVQALPEKQKQAVILYYYEELGISQIADILNCTPSMVHSRLHYAKQALRSNVENMQGNNIKLYSSSAIPVLTIILKEIAKETCTNSVKANLWNGVSNSIVVKFNSSNKNPTKRIKSNSTISNVVSSVAGTSTVAQVVAVVTVIVLVASSVLIALQIANQTTSTNDIIQSDIAREDQTGEESGQTEEDIIQDKEESNQIEDDFHPSNEITDDSKQQTDLENPNIDDTETIIRGSKTATISTKNNGIELPAGSIITKSDGDKTYLSRAGMLNANEDVISEGTTVTVPSDKVSQITVDEDGNKVLPSGSFMTNPDGGKTQYLGNIVVHREYNSIKKLPLQIDFKDGDITITENDGRLSIVQNGDETIVDKDTVFNIVNTGTTEGTVIVDGCEVNFVAIEGNLEVIHSGTAIVEEDVKNDVVTSTEGKTTIQGSVGGNVTTDGEGSETIIGEAVNGEIKDINGGQSNIAESNANKTLPTPNTFSTQTLVLMLLVNLVVLGGVGTLINKKMKEAKKMKSIKKISIFTLSFLLAGTMTVPRVFAQENDIETTEVTETIPVTEEEVTTDIQEDVVAKETANEEITSNLPTKMNAVGRTTIQPLIDSLNGVETLVADVTTLAEAFPDANFRKYVAETVLGKTEYNDTTDSGTVLTQANINTINTRSAMINVSSKEITSLEGIQHFVKLRTLYCYNNQISELDVSDLIELMDLRCYGNKISELDVSNNTKLTTLWCYDNQISELDASNCTKLTELKCYNNQITSLNIAGLINLKTLECYNNKISELDTSSLTSLTALRCYKNKLTTLNVSSLTNLTVLRCDANQISELDVSNLIGLTILICENNMLQELDVSNLVNLTTLACVNNQIDELDVSNLIKLTSLKCSGNPISNLDVAEEAKANMTILQYHYTNIASLDLTGFSSLVELTITNATNANLGKTKFFFVAGSKPFGSPITRLNGDVGSLSWDANTGYYVMAPEMNAVYSVGLPYLDSDGNLGMVDSSTQNLPQGGLIDNEGNLIIGATLSDVNEDGSITLPNGGTIVTGEGTYTFDGSVSIKDGIMTTNAKFTFAKNTATFDPETGIVTANVGTISTSIEVGNGITTISTIGSEMNLPEGSIITNNDGDKIYLTQVGKVDSEGNVISPSRTTTVPADKVGEIITDEDGNVILPVGSIITNANGSIVVSTSNIVLRKDGSILDVKELVNVLFNDNKTDLANGVTQKQINSIQSTINALVNGEEKTALQADIDTAQILLNNRNDAIAKVDDLLKPGIDQANIDEAQKAVNLLPDGPIKDTLQIIIDTVQKALNKALSMDKANQLLELISKLNRSLYTTDSLAKLDEALQKMQSSETYLTQATLDDAITNLQVAYDGLVLLSTDTNGNTNNPTINPDTGTNNQTGTNTGDETNIQSLVFALLICTGLLGSSIIALRKKRSIHNS